MAQVRPSSAMAAYLKLPTVWVCCEIKNFKNCVQP